MEDATSPELAELAEIDNTTTPRISVDGTIMLTGIVGFTCLFFSWIFAFFAIGWFGFAVIDAVAGRPADPLIAALGALGAALVVLVISAVMRWTAHSLLDGRKYRAIVACVLIVAYAASTTGMTATGVFDFSTDLSVVFAVLSLVFTGLLVASFRDRRYWSGQK